MEFYLVRPSVVRAMRQAYFEKRRSRNSFGYFLLAIAAITLAGSYIVFEVWRVRFELELQMGAQVDAAQGTGRAAPAAARNTQSLRLINAPSATAGWRPYRNEARGFEVKYPDSWSVVETEEALGDRVFRLVKLVSGDGGSRLTISPDEEYVVERVGEQVEVMSQILSTLKFIEPSVGGAGKPTLLVVEASGGLCPAGLCRSQLVVASDGSFTLTNEENASRSGTVPPDKVLALSREIAAADFVEIRSRRFSGVCPTAYDGQELAYAFHVSENTVERIRSCETTIQADLPLFTAVAHVLSYVYPSP